MCNKGGVPQPGSTSTATNSASTGTSALAGATNQAVGPSPETLALYQNFMTGAPNSIQQTWANTNFDPSTLGAVAPWDYDRQVAWQNAMQTGYDAGNLPREAAKQVLGAGQQLYYGAGQDLFKTGEEFLQNPNAAFQAFNQDTVDQYMSPYIKDVVNATQAQFNNQNAIQGNQLISKAIASGNAFGGDRAGVGQAQLAGQQQLSQAPVIAGLYQSGYGQALDQYNRMQQLAMGINQLGLGAMGQGTGAMAQGMGGMAQGMGGFGQAAGLDLQGAGLAMNAAPAYSNWVQQGLDMAQRNAMQQQAFPMQMANWYGALLAGMGPLTGTRGATDFSQLGATTGQTASTTTPPSPNLLSQLAGVGLAGAGLVNSLGNSNFFGNSGTTPSAVPGAVPGAEPGTTDFFAKRGGPIRKRKFAEGGMWNDGLFSSPGIPGLAGGQFTPEMQQYASSPLPRPAPPNNFFSDQGAFENYIGTPTGIGTPGGAMMGKAMAPGNPALMPSQPTWGNPGGAMWTRPGVPSAPPAMGARPSSEGALNTAKFIGSNIGAYGTPTNPSGFASGGDVDGDGGHVTEDYGSMEGILGGPGGASERAPGETIAPVKPPVWIKPAGIIPRPMALPTINISSPGSFASTATPQTQGTSSSSANSANTLGGTIGSLASIAGAAAKIIPFLFERGGRVRGFQDGGFDDEEDYQAPTGNQDETIGGMEGSEGGLASAGGYDRLNPAGLAQSRSRYQNISPAMRDRLYALTQAEVGGQGPQAQTALMETVLNRANARDQSLGRAMGRDYYPWLGNPARLTTGQRDQYGRLLDEVLAGSNVSNYATGNASGSVGFAGGPRTAAYQGERFGVEGPDRRWAASMRDPTTQTITGGSSTDRLMGGTGGDDENGDGGDGGGGGGRLGAGADAGTLPTVRPRGAMGDWLANPLTAIGIGMMQGTSPNFLTNVGGGLGAGVKAAQAQRAEDIKMDTPARMITSGPEVMFQMGDGSIWKSGIPTQTAAQSSAEKRALQEQKRQAERDRREAAKPIPGPAGVFGKEFLVYDPKQNKYVPYEVPDESGTIVPPTPQSLTSPPSQAPAAQQPGTPGVTPGPLLQPAAPGERRAEGPPPPPPGWQPAAGETAQVWKAVSNDWEKTVMPAGTVTRPEMDSGRNEDFLRRFKKPGEANYIKDVADYKVDPRKLPENVKAMVMAYDPTWRQDMYATRANALKNFAGSGPEARNFVSNGMAIDHAGQALDLVNKLPNASYVPSVNKIINPARYQLDPAYQNLRRELLVNVDALGNELARTFRGNVGHSSYLEAVRWRDNLNVDDSPNALRASIQKGIKLLGERIEESANRYNDVMGPRYSRSPDSWLTQKARDTYARALTMDPMTGKSPMDKPAPAQQQPPSARQTAPGGITREQAIEELRRRRERGQQ